MADAAPIQPQATPQANTSGSSGGVAPSSPGSGTLPAPELLQPEPEHHMALDLGRFGRLRNDVNELSVYEKPWDKLGWTALGIAAAATPVLITWLPFFFGFSASNQASYGWVAWLLGLFIGIGAAVALMCLVVYKSNKSEMKKSVRHIVAEMDEIHERWKEADAKRHGTS